MPDGRPGTLDLARKACEPSSMLKLAPLPKEHLSHLDGLGVDGAWVAHRRLDDGTEEVSDIFLHTPFGLSRSAIFDIYQAGKERFYGAGVQEVAVMAKDASGKPGEVLFYTVDERKAERLHIPYDAN